MAITVVTKQNLEYYHQKATAATDAKLAQKVDKVEGKQLSTEDFTTELKTKLEGVAAGAQVNVIETVKVNGAALTVTDKAVDIDLSEYAKKSDITTVFRYAGSVETFDALPADDLTVGDVYNVEADGTNYVWNGTAWDDLGGDVDLSGYYTKGEVDSALALKANAADVYDKDTIDTKIAAIEGDVGAVYTKGEIDGMVETINTAIGTKANAADVYAKTETYTKDEVDAAIAAHVCVEGLTNADIDTIVASA